MLEQRNIDKLSGKARVKVWAIALASAPLLTFSQPPVDLPWVGLIALAPLLLALPRLSAGGAWLASFLVGSMYFWVNTWWLGQMTTDPGSEIYVFLMFAFVALLMAAFYGFAGMTIRWLLTRRLRYLIWLVPLAWLGFEFAHEFNTPAPYPWLPVATCVADLTMLSQTVDLFGTYGLSAVVVLSSLGLAASFELAGNSATLRRASNRMHRYVVPIAAVAVLTAGSVYGWVRIGQIERAERDDGPLVACVQGNLAQEVKVRHDPQRIPISFQEHVRLTRRAVEAGAELICWPETLLPGGSTREGLRWGDPEDSASYFPSGEADPVLLKDRWTDSKGRTRRPTYVERLRALIAHEFKTPMLVGTSTPVPKSEQTAEWKDYERRRYNTATLFDERGRYVDGCDKRYIVPGGEYVPLESNPVIRWIVEQYATELQGFASYVERGVRRTLFRLPSRAERLAPRAWAFTASICYEYAWPGCYVELHENAAPYPDFHLNLSNEGWFKESSELDQAVNFCRFRCIESRVPMVRVTNTGITCVIDACGRVRQVLEVDGKDRLVQGLLLARPPVLAHPSATLFVATVKRSLGFVSLGVILVAMAMMAVGRFRDWRCRRARKAMLRGQDDRRSTGPEHRRRRRGRRKLPASAG